MKRNLHSIRVADANWLDKNRLTHLLKLLKEYPCGITQIALFTSNTHIPLTLEENARRSDIMKERQIKIMAYFLTLRYTGLVCFS